MMMQVETQTKERPILFSAEMVSAILDGRKTQTRRVVKPQPGDGWRLEQRRNRSGNLVWAEANDSLLIVENRRCPYGDPGDRLWVRETWSGEYCLRDTRPSSRPLKKLNPQTWYWADGNPASGDWEKPRPSIHMPRWASRILLEVTGVRVERVQEITPHDACAEGIHDYTADKVPDRHDASMFSELWDRINADRGYPWDANPWVWVVEFRVEATP